MRKSYNYIMKPLNTARSKRQLLLAVISFLGAAQGSFVSNAAIRRSHTIVQAPPLQRSSAFSTRSTIGLSLPKGLKLLKNNNNASDLSRKSSKTKRQHPPFERDSRNSESELTAEEDDTMKKLSPDKIMIIESYQRVKESRNCPK